MSNKNKKHQNKSANSVGSKQNYCISAMPNQSKTSSKASFTATLTLLTDWHIGSGAGRTGDIDSLVKRDRDGFPYIPAKTLTGIWRDACELVALGLDNGSDNSDDNPCWQHWVNYLFGDQPAAQKPHKKMFEKFPREAALSVRAAHLSEPLCQALRGKMELKDALTFVKPGIKINAENGCAIEDCLRLEEMVRGGTILEAKCELNLENLNADQKQAAYGLLLAGSKLVERLGGKRRRGYGKCKLVVVEDIEPWIKWIEKHPYPPVLPALSLKHLTNSGKEVSSSNNKAWLCIPFKITIKTPVVISKRTVGNVVETLDYIPGTHLLPIISKNLGSLGLKLGDAIGRGDIIVTNATIEVGGEKGRPVPFALFGEKFDGGLEKVRKVYNRFLEPEPEAQLKGERVGYIGSMKGSHLPKYAKVNLAVETHNTIQDDVQRPTSDVGGVYSYEAIAPETILRSELRLRKSIADAFSQKNRDWYKSLNGEHRLGQSKKDDYGHVSIEFLSLDSNQTIPEIKNSELTVWLLSDVLLRDERLRPTTSIDDLAEELGQVLGVRLKLKQLNDDKLTLIARQHRIDSWQVRWGLPRPSLVGIAAGTCAIFEFEGSLDSSQLSEVQKSGIGERRAEGYGQICFNDPILSGETSKLEGQEDNKQDPPEDPSPLVQPDDCEFSYARIVEKAAWRVAIRRAVLEFAANSDRFGIKDGKPNMSQLGALRSIVRRLEKPEDPTEPGVILKWLEHLEQTPNRKDKWRAEILQKIRLLITDETEVWKLLKFDCSQVTLTSTGETELKGQQWRNMTDDGWNESHQLWTETVQILVDACIRAHKRDIEPNSNSTKDQGVE